MSVTVIGAKEIQDVLKFLPDSITHQTLGAANLEASKPLVQKEKELVPKGETLNLFTSIGAFKVPLRKASELGEVNIGPRRKAPYKGFAGHLIEFGTDERHNASGANRGKVTKDPFVKPAFDATKNEVESRIFKSVAKAVLRTMKRFIKAG